MTSFPRFENSPGTIFDFGYLAIEIGNRRRKLSSTRRMDGGFELAGQLGARKLQGFQLARLLGIPDSGSPRLLSGSLQFFHAFLDAGVRIDQPFA
jgi:hypothetical protein